jgi:hypothetical protein
MTQILGMTIALLLFAGGVWANVGGGSLHQHTGVGLGPLTYNDSSGSKGVRDADGSFIVRACRVLPATAPLR